MIYQFEVVVLSKIFTYFDIEMKLSGSSSFLGHRPNPAIDLLS